MYNPYYGTYVNPYNFNTQAPQDKINPYLQQSQPNISQTQVQTQELSNVIWIQVNGIEGAKDIVVQPNQTKWLMDINSQSFFVKSSDGLGVSNLKCYRFEEFDPISNENNKLDKDNRYVTKDEFEAFKSKIGQYEKKINNEHTENSISKKK